MTIKSANRTGMRLKRSFLGVMGLVLPFVLAPAVYESRAHAQQAAGSENTRQIAFNIPAQDMNAAVLAFARHAGIRVFYDTSKLRGLQSLAVAGTMSPQDALARLLTGSGLTYRFTSATAVTIGAPQSAAGATPAGAISLDTIDVQGSADGSVGYVATRSTAGTKTDTPLMQTPASISVVTNQQIVDQNAQSISQALRYTPGVVAEQRGINEDSLEYLYSRGFQAETYLNGLRLPAPGQAGFNISTRDAYLIDRIESVRGPASILYGQAPPGGIVNIVSKQPLDTPFHEIFIQSGSYGRLQSGFDFSGPLNDERTLLYRVTGVGLNTGTQTDFVDQQRVAIAPSFTWKIGPDTKLTVYANYQNDPKAGIYNFVPAAGTVLPNSVHIPRSMNLGDPGFDRFRKQEASVGYSFEHRFDDVWQVKQNFRYTYNDIFTRQAGPAGTALTNGGTVLQRTPYINYGTLNAAVVDNEAIATFDTGVLKHKALFGLDYQFTQYDHYLYNGYVGNVAAPSLNLLNPVYYQNIPTPNNMLGTSNALGLQQTGLYAQDQISIGKLTIVGGVRQDWASAETLSFKTGAVTNQDWAALTGRAGAIYNFDSGFAPYFSYSTSFQPLPGTTDTGAALKPTEGEQYEVGVKYQPPGYNGYVTVSAFDLRQTNVTVSNTLYIGSITQTGEVRSRGFEFEARTYLTDRLQAIATYTYDDVENTQAAAAILGKAPVSIPLNMASLWLSYDMPENIAPGLKLSGGVRYFDATWGDTINSFRVPAVTLFDLGLQYDLGRRVAQLKGFTATVNVSNLFDKNYIAGCQTLYTCEYGAARLVLAGLKYRW
jgi:iron complex outermembrane receptor protein